MPGNPRPKSRPRVTSHGVYSVKAQVAHENAVAWMLRAALGHERFEGPVVVAVRFYRANRHGVDTDNLLKLVLDAGNHVAWEDDRQVVKVSAEIHIDHANPRTEIEITAAEEEP